MENQHEFTSFDQQCSEPFYVVWGDSTIWQTKFGTMVFQTTLLFKSLYWFG